MADSDGPCVLRPDARPAGCQHRPSKMTADTAGRWCRPVPGCGGFCFYPFFRMASGEEDASRHSPLQIRLLFWGMNLFVPPRVRH